MRDAPKTETVQNLISLGFTLREFKPIINAHAKRDKNETIKDVKILLHEAGITLKDLE